LKAGGSRQQAIGRRLIADSRKLIADGNRHIHFVYRNSGLKKNSFSFTFLWVTLPPSIFFGITMNFRNFIKRTINIIFNPVNEWIVIADEPYSHAALVRTFALPFIILCSVSKFAGLLFISGQFEFQNALLLSLIQFVIIYTGIYLTSKIVYKLAPSFHSEKNQDQAFKLIIYSCVPFFISTFIVNLLPSLFFFQLFYLYTIYLLYNGITVLLKTPDDQKIGYVVISLIILAGISLALYRILIYLVRASTVS
jgi:hypothetical protein